MPAATMHWGGLPYPMHIVRRTWLEINGLEEEKKHLGTVHKYLKFFLFYIQEKGGEGVEPSENRKLEEKPEENSVLIVVMQNKIKCIKCHVIFLKPED